MSQQANVEQGPVLHMNHLNLRFPFKYYRKLEDNHNIVMVIAIH